MTEQEVALAIACICLFMAGWTTKGLYDLFKDKQ